MCFQVCTCKLYPAGLEIKQIFGKYRVTCISGKNKQTNMFFFKRHSRISLDIAPMGERFIFNPSHALTISIIFLKHGSDKNHFIFLKKKRSIIHMIFHKNTSVLHGFQDLHNLILAILAHLITHRLPIPAPTLSPPSQPLGIPYAITMPTLPAVPPPLGTSCLLCAQLPIIIFSTRHIMLSQCPHPNDHCNP